MSLLIIEPFIDPAIKELTQKSLDKLSSLLIALKRIREGWMSYFDDFLVFLKKIQKQDSELYIYPVYLKFLTDKLKNEPHTALFEYLKDKGYDDNKLPALLVAKTFDEGAFLNRLPKDNAWYLWLCIFYLYKPRLTQKFFWENLEYLSSKEEKNLLDNYRTLSFNLQDRVEKNLQELADAYRSKKQNNN